MAYAQDTSVSVEKSRAEIEATLTRYGATRFAYMLDGSEAVIAFQLAGRFVKFVLPLPDPQGPAFTVREHRRMGTLIKRVAVTPEASRRAWEQACRSRWRSLGLCIKAKLEACASGITTFEKEFLAQFVVPGGGTLGDRIIPQLEEMTNHGRMPQLTLSE